MLYQSGDIILNMNQNNEDKNNDEDNHCKLSVQEKKHDNEKKKVNGENLSNYPTDTDYPPKGKDDEQIMQRADSV